MKDKEKQIEEKIMEIAECNKESCQDCKITCTYYYAIKRFCELYLPEDSVVLSREEYEKLKHFEHRVRSGVCMTQKEWFDFCNEDSNRRTCLRIEEREKERKETAEKILDFIQENRHKYEMWYLVSELRKFFGIEKNNDWVFGDLADELNNKFGCETKEQV